MAEGGCAAAMRNVNTKDSWQVHFGDTMRGGKFLNNWRCRTARAGSPDRVWELETYGALFDRTKDGRISQRNFGGHTTRGWRTSVTAPVWRSSGPCSRRSCRCSRKTRRNSATTRPGSRSSTNAPSPNSSKTVTRSREPSAMARNRQVHPVRDAGRGAGDRRHR